MGEIWEIIPPQSGHHSWLSQASPSIPTHTHVGTHARAHTASSELHVAAKMQRDTGMGIEGERQKSVSVCLIGFFQNPS